MYVQFSEMCNFSIILNYAGGGGGHLPIMPPWIRQWRQVSSRTMVKQRTVRECWASGVAVVVLHGSGRWAICFTSRRGRPEDASAAEGAGVAEDARAAEGIKTTAMSPGPLGIP